MASETQPCTNKQLATCTKEEAQSTILLLSLRLLYKFATASFVSQHSLFCNTVAKPHDSDNSAVGYDYTKGIAWLHKINAMYTVHT